MLIHGQGIDSTFLSTIVIEFVVGGTSWEQEYTKFKFILMSTQIRLRGVFNIVQLGRLSIEQVIGRLPIMFIIMDIDCMLLTVFIRVKSLAFILAQIIWLHQEVYLLKKCYYLRTLNKAANAPNNNNNPAIAIKYGVSDFMCLGPGCTGYDSATLI